MKLKVLFIAILIMASCVQNKKTKDLSEKTTLEDVQETKIEIVRVTKIKKSEEEDEDGF